MKYLEQVRRGHPQMTDLQIEFMLSQMADVQTLTGLTSDEHLLKAMALLWPDRIQIDWYKQKVEAVENAIRDGTKELGFSGCSNCVSGDTKIVLSSGEEVSIQYLCENGIAPVVRTIFGPMQASVPFLKGRADLYEITMKSGRRFRATLQHRVLKPSGFASIADCRVGDAIESYECSQVQPPSILEPFPQGRRGDDLHWSGTIPDCQGDYSSCPHPCDERLLPTQDTFRSFSPSPDDALKYTLYICGSADETAYGFPNSHLCSDVAPPSNEDVCCLSAPSGMRSCGHLLSAGREPSIPLSQRQHRFLSDTSLHGPSESPIPDFWKRESEGYWDVSFSREYGLTTDHIAAIRKSDENECFYDLSVPGALHYFAAGVIHHNSGKTAGFADIALAKWWQNPDNTTIYIASPYRNATQQNIWGRIEEQFYSAKELHPWLPGEVLQSQAKIRQRDKNPLSFIQIVAVDDIGKLVGKKSIRTASGVMMIIIDESPNLPNGGQEMLAVLDNLLSVKNFLLLYGGNFADPEDFMGKMSEPMLGYNSIRGQEDTLRDYKTKRRGRVLRFDGYDSPNFRAGQDIYSWVCEISYAAHIAAIHGGTNSPGYLRFIRSWPVTDISEFRVTNGGKIEAGHAEEPAHFTADALVYFSFCDPGFGGDPCIIRIIRVGYELRDGARKQICELDGPPIVVPIDLKRRTDSGDPISAEAQIVAFHKAVAEERNIPTGNNGFDGSLRAGIVHQYAADWSLEVIPVDPQGDATERTFDAKSKRTWRDEVFNFVSETWFAAALLIQSGQMRGLQNDPDAKEQLLKRSWGWRGDRKQIQPKDKFKSGYGGKSPNEADALCGAIEIARRRGLHVLVLHTSGMGAIALMMQIRREKQQSAEIKRIMGGNKLPPGRLSGIETANHGRKRLHA